MLVGLGAQSVGRLCNGIITRLGIRTRDVSKNLGGGGEWRMEQSPGASTCHWFVVPILHALRVCAVFYLMSRSPSPQGTAGAV